MYVYGSLDTIVDRGSQISEIFTDVVVITTNIILKFDHTTNVVFFDLYRVPYLLRNKSLLCLSVCLYVCVSFYLSDNSFYLRNIWRYREIQVNVEIRYFPKIPYFYIYLKKDMVIYIVKNTYFDTIKGIQTNSRDTFVLVPTRT